MENSVDCVARSQNSPDKEFCTKDDKINRIPFNERVKIQREAQDVLKKFSSALASVKLKEKDEKKESGGWREEGRGREGEKGFREMIFANASVHDADAIIAEKKKW